MGVPEECDVVSPLSFVIDSEDPCVGTSGAKRGRVLSLVDELVSVSSLLVEAIEVVELRELRMPWALGACFVGSEQGS